jgi:hypothetical protein
MRAVSIPTTRISPLTSDRIGIPGKRASTQGRACRSRRTQVVTRAALEASSTFAIAQQAAAFAAVAGAEAAYTGTNGREGTPGLPQMTPTLIGCGGAVASSILVGLVPIVGCLAGLGSSGYMLYTYVQRFKDTPQRPEDWPGAKSTPAVMCLITFFIFMAYFQGVTQSFS